MKDDLFDAAEFDSESEDESDKDTDNNDDDNASDSSDLDVSTKSIIKLGQDSLDDDQKGSFYCVFFDQGRYWGRLLNVFAMMLMNLQIL